MSKSDFLSNIKKIYFLNWSMMFLVLMPVIVPFFKECGLDMQEVYLLQSVFAISVAIFEVPSGYISDLLGRKLSIIIGTFIRAFSFTGFIFFDDFVGLAICEVGMAIGIAMFSGSDIALIYDSLEEVEGEVKEQGTIMGNRLFYMQMGEMVAALLGGFIALYSIRYTVIVNGIFCWLPFFISLSLIEPPRNKLDSSKHKDNFIYIFKELFIKDDLLRSIIVNAIVYSVATLLAVWSYQDLWQNLAIPLPYFGILWAINNLVVAISAKWASRLESRIGSFTMITVISLLPIFGFIGMGLGGFFLGMLGCYLFLLCRGFHQVIFADALNSRVKGDMRATANSIKSLGSRLLFIGLGPIMGYLIDEYDQKSAFLGFSGLYIGIFILFTIPLLLKRDRFKLTTTTIPSQK